MPVQEVSLGSVWGDVRALLGRESALMIPVALVTFGCAALIFSLAVPPPVDNQIVGGPWLILLPLVLALQLLGTITITMMALVTGISVGESLARSARLLGRGLLVMLIEALIFAGAMLAIALLVALIGAPMGMAMERMSRIVTAAALPLIFWLRARLLLDVPALVEGGGPIAAIRRSWRLTAPISWKLAIVTFLFTLVSLLLLTAIQLAGGSIFLLIGKALGDPSLGRILSAILGAAAIGLVQMAWFCFAALVYRRVTGSISGT